MQLMTAQDLLRERIGADMRARDWTQADVAAATGISPAKLSRFFRGLPNGVINIEDLEAISRAFGNAPGDYLPNSYSVTPEIARLTRRLGAFSAPEQYHVLQALDSIIEARAVCVEQVRQALGGSAAGQAPRREERARA